MLSFRKVVAKGAPNSMHGFPVQGILPGNTPNSIRPKKLPQDHTWYFFFPQPSEIIAGSGHRSVGRPPSSEMPPDLVASYAVVPEVLSQIVNQARLIRLLVIR
jgi:hypothetical protein